MIKAVRGTRDLLPPDTDLWNRVDAKVRDVFARYNFHEIRTPIFEDTQLFSRSVGEETDIVSKEMFTWYDAGPSPDRYLIAAWIEKHQKELRDWRIESQLLPDSQLRPDVLGTIGDSVVIVEARIKPNQHAVEQLSKYGYFFQMSHPQTELRLILALPERPSDSFIARAAERDIEVEILGLENSDRPQSLTLRPENTAGVVRAYIEHKLEKSGTLQKLYYIGPQFRRERPQKGRYRQFFQIGAEVIGPPSAGSESPARDAEVLEMLATLLDEIGLRDCNLQLNSVGCADDRARYNQALREALKPVVHQMCADCQRRAETNPLRVLDCKHPEDQPIIENLPKISDYLDEPCREHFAAVKAMLDAVGVSYSINDRMVRGLDYYTRTTFEFTHGGLGAQSAVLGGGRYDGLSEALGGPKAPGIGFAIGEDRLILALQSQGEQPAAKIQAFIAPLGAGMNGQALKLAQELRHAGVTADLGDEGFRLKKSFELAEKAGAQYIVIVGENEVAADEFAVKNLSSGEQVKVTRGELGVFLKTAVSS